MMNQFQASLPITDRPGIADFSIRSALLQAVLALVLMVSAFGLFSVSRAIGQQASIAVGKGTPVVTANVLPELIFHPETLEPNLNGMLATGDGGATIPLEEVVDAVLREASERNLIHAKSSTPPTSTR
jgi:hypothetical protein